MGSFALLSILIARKVGKTGQEDTNNHSSGFAEPEDFHYRKVSGV